MTASPSDHPSTLHPARWAVPAFILYALILFTGTHWPNLRIESAYVKRPDLILHLTAFGTWTTLLWASGVVGRRGAWASPVRAGLAGVLYAAFDELSQGIPGLGRTVAWDDYAADCLGVLAGVLASLVLTAWLRRRPL